MCHLTWTCYVCVQYSLHSARNIIQNRANVQNLALSRFKNIIQVCSTSTLEGVSSVCANCSVKHYSLCIVRRRGKGAVKGSSQIKQGDNPFNHPQSRRGSSNHHFITVSIVFEAASQWQTTTSALRAPYYNKYSGQ